MPNVVLEMAMSLDGFISGPNGEDHGLHNYFFSPAGPTVAVIEVGWSLRYAGDKDRQRLLSFLDKYAASMPRTTLRYATEHFDKKQRDHYLGMKKAGKSDKIRES